MRRFDRYEKNHKKKICAAAIICLVISVAIPASYNSRVYASWKEDDDGTYYELEDGENAVGFHEIDGYMYYFNDDGYLQTGKIYIEDEDAYYYADKKGVIQIGDIDTNDAFYFTDEKGVIKTGFVEHDGRTYYYNKRAEQLFGWFEIDGDWYYTGEDGELRTGFITVDEHRYYLEADGKRVSNATMEIDGTTYIFSSDGSVDENATLLYPVYLYVANQRKELGLSDVLMDTKLQACALYRATLLKDGFGNNNINTETLLSNRGVKSSGGYEFSYGGTENYGIDQLIAGFAIDDRFKTAIMDSSVNFVGIGVYTEEGINYFDIIFVSEE